MIDFEDFNLFLLKHYNTLEIHDNETYLDIVSKYLNIPCTPECKELFRILIYK